MTLEAQNIGAIIKTIFLHPGYHNGCVSGKRFEKKKKKEKKSIVAIECLLGDWCQLVNK